jgi:hypothetical protein
MTDRPASKVLGRWRIVEIEGWDTDYVDMLGPGHIQLDRDRGQIEFGAVQIGPDCWYSKTGAHFTFQGSDEGTEVSGDGDANIAEDGSLTGELRFHNGDDMPFIARRW